MQVSKKISTPISLFLPLILFSLGIANRCDFLRTRPSPQLSELWFMSSKEKPTLGGTRIKTRKRNISAPLDPAAFSNAVVQVYLDNAGDLELVAKTIESSDLNLTRYGDTFFEFEGEKPLP